MKLKERIFRLHFSGMGRASGMLFFGLSGIVVLYAFLSTNHADLVTTCRVSDAVLGGHILDFYDHSLRHLSLLAAYFPSTYFLFALWNLPLFLIKGRPYYFNAPEPVLDVGKGIYWSKLLPVIFFILSARLAYDILCMVKPGLKERNAAWLFWLTCPLAFFSQFIFGQYDSFYIFFMLLGLKQLLKGRDISGALLFGISFTFKYFPALVFLPTVFYLFKKDAFKLLRSLLLSVVPLGIELLFFMPSEGFKAIVFNRQADVVGSFGTRLLGGHVTGGAAAGDPVSVTLPGSNMLLLNGFSNGMATAGYFLVLFIILVLFAYFSKGPFKSRRVIEFAVLSTSLFALFIPWSPQWVIFPAVFLLFLPFLRESDDEKLRVFLILDVILMFFYCGYVACSFPWNVDINMFNTVPLFRGINPVVPGETINLAWIFTLGGFLSEEFGRNFYFSGFFAAWIFYLAWYRLDLHASGETVGPRLEPGRENRWLFARFMIGVLIFLLPASAAYFGGQNIYRTLNGSLTEKVGSSGTIVGEIVDGGLLEQTFFSPSENLSEVDVKLATFGRDNFCFITLQLVDDAGQSIASRKLPCQAVVNNAYFPVKFSAVRDSANRMYKVRVTAEGAMPGNAVTIWASDQDAYPQGSLLINGRPAAGDLDMVLRWK